MRKSEIDRRVVKYKTENVWFYESEIGIIENKIIREQISYFKIKNIELTKGFLLRNNLIIIVGCIGMIYYSLQLLNYSLKAYQSEEMGVYGFLMFFFNKGSMLSTWGPLLLCIAALCGIYTSFLRSHIIKIHTDNKTYKFRIWEITKEKQYDEFIFFLNGKLN